jgi:hypothetical protein
MNTIFLLQRKVLLEIIHNQSSIQISIQSRNVFQMAYSTHNAMCSVKAI